MNATTSAGFDKPPKPKPDFPLFAHATRRWAKKVRGKTLYFGPWEDAAGALARWNSQKSHLLAGRTPKEHPAPKQKPSTKRRKGGAPAKPHPDFPLFPHKTGRWAKKVRGKMHYFGPWGDPDAALRRWLHEKDDLLAGRQPRAMGEETTRIRDICNAFLNAKRRAVEVGELEARTFRDYKRTTDALVAHFGPDRPVSEITPRDLGLYRVELAKTNGPVALGNIIQRVRSVFKFAYENDILDKPLRFGSEFKKPSRNVARKMRATQPKRYLAANEIRALLDATKPLATGVQLRAMILLGVNCGLGNNDIAELNWAHLDLKAAILDFSRPKTGIERRATLWPETIAALRELRKWARAEQTTGEARGLVRYRPTNSKDADAVFLTRHQVRFVQHLEKASSDSVGQAFGKLMRSVTTKSPTGKTEPLKRLGVGFYSLRHVFETHAGETRDQPAVDRIMGHTDDSMAEHYREWHKDAVEDTRLRAVTEHVRQWLFGGGK